MTENNVKEIEELIKIISKLPGLGSKSAKRIVIKLIKNREELIKPLANTLAQVYKNVVRCKVCGNLKSVNSNCTCSKNKYDQICVVENIADMWVIESTGIYKGHYHILGGTLPTYESKKDDGLLVSSLINRVKNNSIKEIIIATNLNLEGEATAMYLQQILSEANIKITRLARGMPSGSDIEYADQTTISHALNSRVDINENIE